MDTKKVVKVMKARFSIRLSYRAFWFRLCETSPPPKWIKFSKTETTTTITKKLVFFMSSVTFSVLLWNSLAFICYYYTFQIANNIEYIWLMMCDWKNVVRQFLLAYTQRHNKHSLNYCIRTILLLAWYFWYVWLFRMDNKWNFNEKTKNYICFFQHTKTEINK